MKNLSLYKVNKRINSTLLPTAEQLIGTMGVALKHATSIDVPTFVIAVGADDIDKIWSANYASYEGSYYWITDIVQINNTHVELQCKKDSLATYKDFILNTKAYVLYSDSHGRTDIEDSRQNYTCSKTILKNSQSVVYIKGLNNEGTGTVVLTVSGENIAPTTGMGCGTIYLLNINQSQRLANDLNMDNGALVKLASLFGNAADGFIGFHWIPVDLNYLSSVYNERFPYDLQNFTDFNIVINNYHSRSTAEWRIIKLHTLTETYPIYLPEGYSITNFVDTIYNKITLYLPYYGTVDIPAEFMMNQDHLEVDVSIDVSTGDLMYVVKIQGTQIAAYNTNFACQIPLGATLDKTLSSTIAGLGMITTGGIMTASGNTYGISPIIAGSTQIANGIMTGIHTQIRGGLGGRISSDASPNIILRVDKVEPTEPITAKKSVLGLPCCETLDLSALSGFCQCQGASVSAPAMESEIREINNFLNGGVYLE